MKNNVKGITLIALVITITISLILSSITIAAISGDSGIISRAGKAKTETEAAEERERIENEIIKSNDKSGDLDLELLKDNFSEDMPYLVCNNPSTDSFPISYTSSKTNKTYEIDEIGNVETINE